MTNSDPLIARAERWISHDPDADSRAELGALIGRARDAADPGARADLSDRFLGPLEFGTAGLRGLLGAGESRMNRAVVLRTTAGLGTYLLAELGDAVRKRGVVVGFDGRHMGREFAEDVACTLAALGIRTHTTPLPCSTPITAFAVLHLGAAAGIMVTASHNPPEYNGYKVYWQNGAQIIPPHDARIAAAIAAMPEADAIARMPIDEAERQGLARKYGDEVDGAYLAQVARLRVRADGDRTFPIVYTPMHGTGNRLTRRALADAGFSRVTTVPEQAEPDGDFPTVAFPNPEEKGALDLAFALARRDGAELVLANDPDVDRLAVAARGSHGDFVQLTGNQVGVLLGHYLLTEGAGGGERLVVASCVSTPMLGVIATALGVRYEETLTGFKWIANRAMELERDEGLRFVFGFEEALGYTVGRLVRDKDGISAAVLVAEMAAVLRARRQTLLDRMDALYREYGLFVSSQRSITMKGGEGQKRIAELMTHLRESAPERIGALEVVAMRDFDARVRTSKDGTTAPIGLPRSNILMFDLEGGSRIIARPSGTEPKVKFYFDVREPVRSGEPLEAAEARARELAKDLEDGFVAIAAVS